MKGSAVGVPGRLKRSSTPRSCAQASVARGELRPVVHRDRARAAVRRGRTVVRARHARRRQRRGDLDREARPPDHVERPERPADSRASCPKSIEQHPYVLLAGGTGARNRRHPTRGRSCASRSSASRSPGASPRLGLRRHVERWIPISRHARRSLMPSRRARRTASRRAAGVTTLSR